MKNYRTYEMKNNIRLLRLKHGFTQSDLAYLCGTTQNTISSLERFEYEPSAYLASLLCQALYVPFDQLFYYEYEGVKAPIYTLLDGYEKQFIHREHVELEFHSLVLEGDI